MIFWAIFWGKPRNGCGTALGVTMKDYRNLISELISRLMNSDPDDVRATLEPLWGAIDPESLFAVAPYLKFVQSLSRREMNAAQRFLFLIAQALRHGLEVTGAVDRANRVVIPLRLMRDFFGTVAARLVIKVRREVPELPIEEAILSLHKFVMSVQSADIIKKNDSSIEISDRVRSEWQATRKQLSQLWIAVENEKQPDTSSGPRDPASG